jgi:PAT family beta-lactamase induction signal transducer AmpG
MIDISKKSWHKYFLFGSLYFAEGIQFALAIVIIPIYLLDKGFSIPLVTLVEGLAMAPWYLKFIFGPTTDYFYKLGRKPFIIAGGLIGAISLFVLIFINPLVFLIPFVLFLFISHIGIIYLDVSCDGWAIQISKENERGKINSAMTIGSLVGMAFGTSVIALIAQFYGYGMSFLAGGGIILLSMIYPSLIKEVKILEKRPKITTLLKKEFKKRNTQLLTINFILLGISSGLVIYLIPLFMKTILKLDIGQIGLITTIYPITFIIGSLLSGFIVDRFGRKMILAIVIIINTVFYQALIFTNNWQIFALIYALCGIFDGGWMITIGTMQMDLANPKIGATQFSILTSLSNFGEVGIGTISGSLVIMLGYARMFFFSSWICGPALLILYFVRPKKNELQGKENERKIT